MAHRRVALAMQPRRGSCGIEFLPFVEPAKGRGAFGRDAAETPGRRLRRRRGHEQPHCWGGRLPMLSFAYPWLAELVLLPLLVLWLLPAHAESRRGVRVPFFGL